MLFLGIVRFFIGKTIVAQRTIVGSMIKSFRDKATQRIFERHFTKRLAPTLHQLAWRKLAQLDAADRLEDLLVPPGNRLEKLSGDVQSSIPQPRA